MTGRVVRILAKTAFDYGNLTAGAATGEILIAKNVDIAGMRDEAFLARIHAQALSVAGSLYQIIVRSSAPSTEDPATTFEEAGAAPIIALATIASSTTTAGTMVKISFPATPCAGAWVNVYLVATRAGGGGTVQATLSIDLVIKE